MRRRRLSPARTTAAGGPGAADGDRPAEAAPADPESVAPAGAVGTDPEAVAPSVVLTKGEPQDRAPAPEAAPAPQEQAQAQPQAAAPPLHAPDEYRTPPYGEPGPWAPAPPCSGPVPVPPQQGPVPPQAHPQHQPHPQGRPRPGGSTTLGRRRARLPAPAREAVSRKGLAVAGALVFALITGVVGGGIGAYVERNGGITAVELPQAAAEDTGRAPDSVAGIAASALPGVVTLHVKGSGSSGTGTGFVLDTRGHILTNNHVVDGARSSADISVTFSSGETARAKLVGKDTGYDLAVVQVTGVSGLKALPSATPTTCASATPSSPSAPPSTSPTP